MTHLDSLELVIDRNRFANYLKYVPSMLK